MLRAHFRSVARRLVQCEGKIRLNKSLGSFAGGFYQVAMGRQVMLVISGAMDAYLFNQSFFAGGGRPIAFPVNRWGRSPASITHITKEKAVVPIKADSVRRSPVPMSGRQVRPGCLRVHAGLPCKCSAGMNGAR